MVRSPRVQSLIAERHERMLEVGLDLFLEHGYAGLNMDEIAVRLNCSKGTVYNHFRSKEDLLAEMGGRAADKRLELFAKAAASPGPSRLRMGVLGFAAELFVRLFPHFFRVEVIMRTDSLRERVSHERSTILSDCESRCMGIVTGIVRDGIAAGDLELEVGRNPEDVTFGLWSMTWGGYTLVETGTPLLDLGVNEPFGVINRNAQSLLDGLGWQPLSVEHELDVEEAARDVFAAELAEAEARRDASPGSNSTERSA